jgi:hypothetical protein
MSMVSKHFQCALAAGALLWALPARAQDAAAVPAAEQQPAPEPAAQAAETQEADACCTVAALTPVEIEITELVSSNLSKSRQTFTFKLAAPLVASGRVVAPAGTPGVGEVVHAAKSGIGGKAGELILAARYLEIGGQRVGLRSLRYGRAQGKDSSGTVGIATSAAAAVVPVAAVVGFLITGGEVRIPEGTRAYAKIAADTVLPPRD